jgi:signal transduction histidine kinase
MDESGEPPSSEATFDGIYAALQRVSALVATDSGPKEICDAVAHEMARLTDADAAWIVHFNSGDFILLPGIWPPAELSLPIGTRQEISDELRLARDAAVPYRVDTLDPEATGPFVEEALRLGIVASLGVPIFLHGQVWGLGVVTLLRQGSFSDSHERSLAHFLELVSPALASSQALTEARQADEGQRAFSSVAGLASADPQSDELFRAIAVEASRVIQGVPVTLVQFTKGGTEAKVLAVSGGHIEVGRTFPTPDDSIVARAARSGRPERIDDYPLRSIEGAAGPLDVRAAVASPVTLGNEPWGALAGFSDDGILPPDAEHWLSLFAAIGSAAISGWKARSDLRRLSEEQTALMRVADLVARRRSEPELFDAVAREASGILDHVAIVLFRLADERTMYVVASHGGPIPVGTRLEIPKDDGGDFDQLILTLLRRELGKGETDAADQIGSHALGLGFSVSVPVVVDERVWGRLSALGETEPLPASTAERLERFAEFVAPAIAASDAQSAVDRLAEEQASLLRVSEAVARGMPLHEVFETIAIEASNLLGGVATSLMQYDSSGAATSVSAYRSPAPIGLQVPSDAHGIGDVFRTGRAVRVDSFEGTNLAGVARELDVLSGVAVPITVERMIWGTLTASSSGSPLASDVEVRLEKFAALAAVAIANAQNKEQLVASRARVQATADEARSRVQRDVHDGAQQQLIQTVLALKLALAAATRDEPTDGLITEALGYAERATSQLRDVVHGILPVSLSRGGLRAGLESLIVDFPVPVRLDFDAPRCPSEIEVTAYFVIAESLTNVVKHAQASRIEVGVHIEDGQLVVTIADDGIGGADPSRGSGMVGLNDRLQAQGGALAIESQLDRGTSLRATLPIAVTQSDDPSAPSDT